MEPASQCMLSLSIQLVYKTRRFVAARTKARTKSCLHFMAQIHCCASELALLGKLLVPHLATKYQKSVKCWHRYGDFLEIL